MLSGHALQRVQKTLWIVHHRVEIYSVMKALESHSSPQLWEEGRVPRSKPCKYEENMQTPHRQDQDLQLESSSHVLQAIILLQQGTHTFYITNITASMDFTSCSACENICITCSVALDKLCQA